MIEKLLGHEVQYDIPEYHGDNKNVILVQYQIILLLMRTI